MAFSATEFIYDGVHGGVYGLSILDIDNQSSPKRSQTLKATVYSGKTARSIKRSFYKTTFEDVLEFDMTVLSETPLNSYQCSEILDWLVGRQGYKRLEISQHDRLGTYYNCIFTEAETVYIGNRAYGFTLHAVCDSPFYYGQDFTRKYEVSATTKAIKFDLATDCVHDYIYPTVTFKCGAGTSSFSIKNLSEPTRIFSFTGLAGDETVTVDNEKQIVTSSQGINRLGTAFSKKWLRLSSGINKLEVSCDSDTGELTITAPIIYKAGA